MMFPLVLIAIGGFASVVAAINRRFPPLTPKPLLPYVGYICLFAGLGAFVLSMGLWLVGEELLGLRSQAPALGFVGGYVLGGCGGAALGFMKACKLSRPE